MHLSLGTPAPSQRLLTPLPHTCTQMLHADAVSSANAIATAYMNDYNQGATRPPTVAECEAAASASTDVLSSGGDSSAFAAAQAKAQASGETWGTPGWKATFTSACKASASASSRTWTNSDGTVHTGEELRP
jgi:hypothetical protein